MVVMGAISRSAIGRFLLGSTAEWVLDALPCDVLIVKPARMRRASAKRGHDSTATGLTQPIKGYPR
jgi:hypothetical protein